MSPAINQYLGSTNKLNMMYPDATEASLKEQLHHQFKTWLLADTLLGELIMGKDVVQEYLGRYLPPAALALIQPPMHGQVKLPYMVQHMLSRATHAAYNEVVAICLHYNATSAFFYEATGKASILKDDIEALCKPWEAIKQALLDVKRLHIPLPGAPLVFCTDAAGASD
ncbi:hypothetical protein H4S08_004881 [Coemansia sp. RSA 1365]|nr:hypothetical protein H4S08_004881 [Coemansia sp. RSA 1365]